MPIPDTTNNEIHIVKWVRFPVFVDFFFVFVVVFSLTLLMTSEGSAFLHTLHSKCFNPVEVVVASLSINHS